jgi:hypothetical protein
VSGWIDRGTAAGHDEARYKSDDGHAHDGASRHLELRSLGLPPSTAPTLERPARYHASFFLQYRSSGPSWSRIRGMNEVAASPDVRAARTSSSSLHDSSRRRNRQCSLHDDRAIPLADEPTSGQRNLLPYLPVTAIFWDTDGCGRSKEGLRRLEQGSDELECAQTSKCSRQRGHPAGTVRREIDDVARRLGRFPRPRIQLKIEPCCRADGGHSDAERDVRSQPEVAYMIEARPGARGWAPRDERIVVRLGNCREHRVATDADQAHPAEDVREGERASRRRRLAAARPSSAGDLKAGPSEAKPARAPSLGGGFRVSSVRAPPAIRAVSAQDSAAEA